MVETRQGGSAPREPEPPANLGWLPWIGHYLASEWPVIRAAPLTNFFVAVVAFVLGASAIAVFYSERISTYEARDRYISGQLMDYKDAFPGKSPDEAAKEVVMLRGALTDTQKHLDVLEKAVSLAEEERRKEIADVRKKIDDASRHAFVPWTLTSVQKTKLGKVLDEEVARKFPIVVKCLIGSSQSQSFTASLVEVFNAHGWQATAACLGSNLRPDLTGVYLAIPQISMFEFGPVTEETSRILYIFNQANIEIDVGSDNDLVSGFWIGVANPKE
jgi:hypothetical protein